MRLEKVQHISENVEVIRINNDTVFMTLGLLRKMHPSSTFRLVRKSPRHRNSTNNNNRYIHDVDASVILRKQLADIYYILPHTKGGTWCSLAQRTHSCPTMSHSRMTLLCPSLAIIPLEYENISFSYSLTQRTNTGTRKMIVLLPKPETRWTPTGNDDSMLAAYNRGDTSKLFVLNRDVEDSGKISFSRSSTTIQSNMTHKISPQVHFGHSKKVRKILLCFGTVGNVSWHLVKLQRINFVS